MVTTTEGDFVGYDLPDFDLNTSKNSCLLVNKELHPSYGNDFRLFFESLDDEYFIYTMEDQFIYDMVEVDLVYRIIKLCETKRCWSCLF